MTTIASKAKVGGKKGVVGSKRKLDPSALIIASVVAVILLLLIIYPLFKILSAAVSGEGLAVLEYLFTSFVARRIIINTLVLGVLVGALGTLLGFIMAFIQVRVACKGKKLMHILCLVPIVSPPFALATSVITLFGRRGLITYDFLGIEFDIYGLKGLTLVLVISYFPVAYMNFKGLLESLDPSLDEATANLGASKLYAFKSVTLPMLIPGFAGSFLLLFVEAIADLANPLVLGGDYTVLASRIYIAITGEYAVAAGAAYSVILLLPSLLVFLIQRYWVSRKNVVTVTGKPAGKPVLINNPSARIPLTIFAVLITGYIVLLYGTVIFGSFVHILGIDNTLTLDNYRYVLSGIGNESIMDTTILALCATPIAGLLGMVIAWLVVRKLKKLSGVFDFLGMLGLAVPGTVIGIGYAIAFSNPIIIGDRQFFPAVGGGGAMFGGALAIIMVFVIRSLPSGQQSGISALRQIDPSIDEASASLGASSITTFRKVTLPLIKPAFLAGLIYAFARSMTTISPIIFITTPQTQIMTKQILAECDAGRFGNAFAFCTILLLIVTAGMGLLSLILRGSNKRNFSANAGVM